MMARNSVWFSRMHLSFRNAEVDFRCIRFDIGRSLISSYRCSCPRNVVRNLGLPSCISLQFLFNFPTFVFVFRELENIRRSSTQSRIITSSVRQRRSDCFQTAQRFRSHTIQHLSVTVFDKLNSERSLKSCNSGDSSGRGCVGLLAVHFEFIARFPSCI